MPARTQPIYHLEYDFPGFLRFCDEVGYAPNSHQRPVHEVMDVLPHREFGMDRGTGKTTLCGAEAAYLISALSLVGPSFRVVAICPNRRLADNLMCKVRSMLVRANLDLEVATRDRISVRNGGTLRCGSMAEGVSCFAGSRADVLIVDEARSDAWIWGKHLLQHLGASKTLQVG